MEVSATKSQEDLVELTAIDPKKKEGRKRKRHIFNAIREQMEFYFGDANLNKDRFMKQLIKNNKEFVPLEIFLNFNKIKALADSEEMLVKALAESKLLELDDSKKKVRRKTAVKEVTDTDERTIYVEALPNSVDHDWIKTMFSRFGKVTYVSLPKYPQSRKPKDFGFVEFQNEKSVSKAIAAFKAFNGVLCFEETDPSKLASIKSHNLKAEPEEKKESLKRPCPEVQDAVKAKKIKLENDSGSTDEEDSSSDENKTDGELKKESGDTKKKRRKHKKSAEKRKKQLELSTDASFYELKILPKRDWKRLRNKYLNLQREKAAELKRKAAKERQLQQLKENAAAASNSATETSLATKKSKNEERIKMKMNFYGAGGVDTELPAKHAKIIKGNTESLKPFMKFEKGLIVEMKFEKPCVDIKEFKQEMRQYKVIKYVDIKEGGMEAFLRFESTEEAVSFAQNKNDSERKCIVLSGETEASYWEKIERDRQMKRNKEIKIPTKRGREKVKAALAKHIWFGDEEGE